MIVSVSRRTDIPAYYMKWFLQKLKDGYVDVTNPFNKKQVRCVSLRQQEVDFFVFWTRNAKHFIKHLDEINAYGIPYYFHYTLMGYGRQYEHKTPCLQEALATLRELAELIGKDRVIWRYDPIIISSTLTSDWHKSNVKNIIEVLKHSTNHIIISMVDRYIKNKTFWKDEKVINFNSEPASYLEVATFIREEAQQYNITVQSCCEPLLSAGLIEKGACIDPGILFGERILFKKDHAQRTDCLCAKSVDIGVYNTCFYQCRYCYATGENPVKLR